jgi:hypothetical protein
MQNQAKEIFILQTELIDTKVDMAVSKAIDRVVQQIAELRNDLRNEMHGMRNEIQKDFHDLKGEMNTRFSTLENDVTAIKTRLGMRTESRAELRNRILDYTFKACWTILAGYFLFHHYPFS